VSMNEDWLNRLRILGYGDDCVGQRVVGPIARSQ
jgi:hypothetical protein